ncbi:unnamed protein product [Closterium sp. NIES-54]
MPQLQQLPHPQPHPLLHPPSLQLPLLPQQSVPPSNLLPAEPSLSQLQQRPTHGDQQAASPHPAPPPPPPPAPPKANSQSPSPSPAPSQPFATQIRAGFAKLHGEDFEYFMQSYSVVLGRNSKKSSVDLDLSALGGGMNVSRNHARIFYDFAAREFRLEVLGKNGVYVDGQSKSSGSDPIPLKSQQLLQLLKLSLSHVLLPLLLSLLHVLVLHATVAVNVAVAPASHRLHPWSLPTRSRPARLAWSCYLRPQRQAIPGALHHAPGAVRRFPSSGAPFPRPSPACWPASFGNPARTRQTRPAACFSGFVGRAGVG